MSKRIFFDKRYPGISSNSGMRRLTLSWPKPVAALSLVVLTLLTACEANLNMDGVERTKQQAIRRTDQLLSMTRISDRQLMLVGNNGLILLSKDNGRHWQRRELPARPNFIDSDLCPDGTLVALAYERSIWTSKDQGASWVGTPMATTEEVQSLDCSPDGSLWVAGSFSTLLQSRDLGKSWQQQSLDEDAMLTAIEFLSPTQGLAAGEFGIFITTRDGGKTWNREAPVSDEFFPLALHFRSPRLGWAASLSGVIMHTNDGGLSWHRQQTASHSPIYNFVPVEDSLYALGDHGTVLRLQENRWVKTPSPDLPIYLRTGLAIDDQRLLVAGGWGTLLTLDLKSPTDSLARK